MVYGIDPGLSGAIALMVNGELREIEDIPTRQEGTGKVKRRVDAAGLAAIVRDWRARFGVDSEQAVIERVASMPSQGVASVFSLGHTAGAVEATMLALGCPVAFVAPATWKRALGCTADKASSQARASLLFPSQAGLWARVKDHNRAEAVMLAHYGSVRLA